MLRLPWLPLQLGAPGFEVSQARGCAQDQQAVRESRRLPNRLLVPGCTIAEQGLCHQQQCNFLSLYTSRYAPGFVVQTCVNDIPCEASARSRKAESCQARYQSALCVDRRLTATLLLPRSR
ncbi:hypothetical protein Taro_000083, partial [Colocasia esculenta]|nr:hypothetical protein [Colocasia esculenta]